MKPRAALFLTLLTAAAHAGPRSSTNYSIPTDSTDAGGKRATSAAYTNDGSAGGVVGISTVATPAETAKHGDIGQLTKVTALQLAAAPATVNETATRQLSGTQLLDDLTTNAVPAASISWSVQSGPLTGINTSGLATAATVYQDTAALLLDPDGDGQNNRFEFTAGLVPTNPLSRFLISIAEVPGQATQIQVVFDPIVAGRSYTVKTSPDLTTGSWVDLVGGSVTNNGDQRTVTDTSASETKKFYKIKIVKP